MIESSLAFTLFDKALSVLGLIRDKKQRRTEKTDQALLALYDALAETRSYISELQSGKPQNREREFAIARLWSTASVPLREIDRELAERCFEKGGYWMEPEAWDSKRIEAKGIKIESMFEATRQLLRK
jgi:hypothetical protein